MFRKCAGVKDLTNIMSAPPIIQSMKISVISENEKFYIGGQLENNICIFRRKLVYVSAILIREINDGENKFS